MPSVAFGNAAMKNPGGPSEWKTLIPVNNESQKNATDRILEVQSTHNVGALGPSSKEEGLQGYPVLSPLVPDHSPFIPTSLSGEDAGREWLRVR